MHPHRLAQAMPLLLLLSLGAARAASATAITGKITDGNGFVVVGASIQANTAGTTDNVANTASDATGSYALTVNAGTYDLVVTAPAGSGLEGSTLRNLAVSGATLVENFTLAGLSGIEISGAITTSLGDVAPDTQVSLKNPTTLAIVTSTCTDAAGKYSLSAPPGSYRIHVHLTNCGTTWPQKVPRIAIDVTAKSSAAYSADTTFNYAIPTVKTSVSVKKADGSPFPNVAIHPLSYNWGTPFDTTPLPLLTDANGNLTIAFTQPSIWGGGNNYSWALAPPITSGYVERDISGLVYPNGPAGGVVTMQLPVTWTVSLQTRGSAQTPPYIAKPRGVRATSWVQNSNYQVTFNTAGQATGLANKYDYLFDTNGLLTLPVDRATDYQLYYYANNDNKPDYPEPVCCFLNPFGYNSGYRNDGKPLLGNHNFFINADTASGAITPPTCFMSGTVTNKVSGLPLAGAQVSVVNLNNVIKTDASGHYTFPMYKGYPFDVKVTPSGGDAQSGTLFSKVTCNDDMTQDFAIDSFVTISGHIYGPDGVTPVYMGFTLYDAVYTNLGTYATNQTTGAFTVKVNPGQYMLYFQRNALAANTTKNKVPEWMYLYPYADTNAAKTGFVTPTVGKGLVSFTTDVPNLDIVLPTEEINGRIIDSNGLPIVNASVTMWMIDDTYDMSHATTAADGTYHLPFMPWYFASDRDPNTAGTQYLTYNERLLVRTPNQPEYNLRYFNSPPNNKRFDYTSVKVLPPAGANFVSATLRQTSLGEMRTSFAQNFILKTIDATPPALLSGPTVTDHTDTSFTVQWTTDESSTSEVLVGPAGGTLTLAASSGALVTSHTLTVTNLTPDTSYDFKVSSTDDDGNRFLLGAAQRVKTAAAADVVAPKLLSDVVASDMTQSSAQIAWTTDEAATSTVLYGTTAAFGLQQAETGYSASHSVKLSGLAAGTTYFFGVRVCDTSGNCATYLPKTAATFRTLDTPDLTPPVILTGPSVSGITSTTAVISWTTDEASTTAVTAHDAANHYFTPNDGAFVTNHSLVLTGLSPSTQYLFQATSSDKAGNQIVAPATGTLSFTTTAVADTTPPSITGPAVQYLSPTIAVISWTTNEAADGAVDYVLDGVTYTLTDGNGFGTTHQVQIGKLPPGTDVPFTVKSKDAAGNGPSSKAGTMNTGTVFDTAAPVISNINVTKTETTATITWTTDEVATTRVDYAAGTLADATQLTLVRNDAAYVTAHSVQLVNLSSWTTYSFAVSSVDPSTNPRQSAILTFRTNDGTAPVLTVTPAALTVEATSAAGIAKAAVTLPTYTATDNSGVIASLTDNAPATFPLGNTTVTVTAKDGANNTATQTYVVTVRDTTGPSLSCPSAFQVVANGPLGAEQIAGAPDATSQALQAFFAGVTATDAVSNPVTVTNDAPALAPVGTTQVTFTAKDSRNNASTCTTALLVEEPSAKPPALTCPADLTLAVGGGATIDWTAAFGHPVSVELRVLGGGAGLTLSDALGKAQSASLRRSAAAATDYAVRVRATDLVTGVSVDCNRFIHAP